MEDDLTEKWKRVQGDVQNLPPGYKKRLQKDNEHITLLGRI